MRAQGDGKGYEATWGAAAETTGTCNNVPAFGEESYAFSIAEDAALDAAVGSVSATDDDTGDTLTYAFTDEDTVEKFAIASATGAITVAASLDYETTPSYTLSVQVSDDNGGTASVEVVITVTNVPEGLPPMPANLIVSLADTTFSFTWDAVESAAKYRVQFHTGDGNWADAATDITGTTASFSPTDGPACGTTYSFQALPFGDGVTYIEDWGTASDSESVTTDACNQIPAFTNAPYSFSVFEDAEVGYEVGTVTAEDLDTDDTLSFSISEGNEAGKFNISSSTDAITVAASLDYETTPSYTLSVQVSDDNGGTASAEVVITVTNVPEGLPPMPANLIVSLADTTFSFTWDAVESAAKYRVQFHTGDGNWADAATDITGTTASFSPSDGPACGTTYSFQALPFGDGVTYIEDWGTASDSESVTTDACNQIPAFTNAPYSFSVFEDAEVGYEVGTVTAEDLDTDDTLSFSISEGNEAGKFNISSSTGAITVAVALDYETTPSLHAQRAGQR